MGVAMPYNDAFDSRGCYELPTYDGIIRLGLAKQPVPYHFSLGFRGRIGQSDCRTLAMMSCSMACMSADVIRGRMVANQLQRKVSEPCMQRLRTMSSFVRIHMSTDEDLRRQMRVMPIVPQWLHGMVISPERCEITIRLTIGTLQYLSNIVLRQVGSRWMCTFADFG